MVLSYHGPKSRTGEPAEATIVAYHESGDVELQFIGEEPCSVSVSLNCIVERTEQGVIHAAMDAGLLQPVLLYDDTGSLSPPPQNAGLTVDDEKEEGEEQPVPQAQAAHHNPVEPTMWDRAEACCTDLWRELIGRCVGDDPEAPVEEPPIAATNDDPSETGDKADTDGEADEPAAAAE